MSLSETAGMRRRRLWAALQGRPIEAAILHSEIRADLEAEVAEADSNALITPERWAFLRELVAEKRAAEAEAGPELFFSTDLVVLVPGFMASTLSDTAEEGLGLIWIDPKIIIDDRLRLLQLGPYDGREADLDPRARIQAIGPLPLVYDLLRLALEVRRYSTKVFPVDWRKDLDLSARRLAHRLRGLASQEKPIHLVAHSQGALVARRALQTLGAEEARRIVRNLVLLGPANFGSFSAVLGLAGADDVLGWLGRWAVAPVGGFQRVLASMSGLYQLLPCDPSRTPWLGENDLGRPDFWRCGGIDEARLARFLGWPLGIDAAFFNDRTVVILGDPPGTPTVGGVVFEGTTMRPSPAHDLPGDGTVPHACSVLPGTTSYLAPGAAHAFLAADRGAIQGVLDVLAGRSVRLPAVSSRPADHLHGSCKAKARSAIGPTDFGPTQHPTMRRDGAEATRPTPVARSFGLPAPKARLELSERDEPELELNGTFLSGYEAEDDESEVLSPAHLHRRDQLRAEAAGRTLQAAQPVARTLQAAQPAEADKRPLFELILDASNLLPFDFLRTGDRLGRSVLKIQRGDGASGTGFLVAPDILLTNHHVLPDIATATSARALANYERAPADDPAGQPADVPLAPQTLFVTNADLDFTFCAVEGLDHLGGVPLDRNSLNVIKSENVNIVQHPRGRPKEIALQDNQVIKADNVVVQYTCDTEPGSSGSPVFNNQWKLVALHHASVATEHARGRAVAADPTQRYLNEGIRLSAIATWLETAGANTPGQREQVARLRSIFAGLDPQIGFFGALGRKADGKSGPEVVIETYHDSANDLDIAYWSLRDLSHLFHERLDGFGRVVADMNMDLWCLTHATVENLRALCHHLETNFQLEYDFLLEPASAHPPVAVVYRRTAGLAVERLERGADDLYRAAWPIVVQVRATMRDGGIVVLTLAPFPHADSHGLRWSGSPAARSLLELVGGRVEGAGPRADWVLIGDVASLLSRESVRTMMGLGFEIWAAAGPRDGAVVLLAGPESRVEQIFVSPNLELAVGLPESLVVTRDRKLPAHVEELAEHHPIALRLVLNDQKPSRPLADPVPVALVTPEPSLDSHLEQRIKDLLAPIIVQIIAESWPRFASRSGDIGARG
jgi:hypothetical protein